MQNSANLLNSTDETIAYDVQQGKIELYEILMKRYEQKLSRYARRFLSNPDDIEDIIQQVFIKAYTNIKSFDSSRRFSPWIYRITHNEIINSLKKNKNAPLPLFDPDTFFPHPVAKENPLKDSEKKDLALIMESCLNKLDLKYREPLVLYYFEDLSYQEISDVLKIPISTIGVRISRGKEKIKQLCNEKQF